MMLSLLYDWLYSIILQDRKHLVLNMWAINQSINQ